MLQGETNNEATEKKRSLKNCSKFYEELNRLNKQEIIFKKREKILNQAVNPIDSSETQDPKKSSTNDPIANQGLKKQEKIFESEIIYQSESNMENDEQILLNKFENFACSEKTEKKINKISTKNAKNKALKKTVFKNVRTISQKSSLIYFFGDTNLDFKQNFTFFPKPYGKRCLVCATRKSTIISPLIGKHYKFVSCLPNGNPYEKTDLGPDKYCLIEGFFNEDTNFLYLSDIVVSKGTYVGLYSAEYRYFILKCMISELDTSLIKTHINDKILDENLSDNTENELNLQEVNLELLPNFELTFDNLNNFRNNQNAEAIMVNHRDSYYRQGLRNVHQMIFYKSIESISQEKNFDGVKHSQEKSPMLTSDLLEF